MAGSTNSEQDFAAFRSDLAALKHDVTSLIEHIKGGATDSVQNAAEQIDREARGLVHDGMPAFEVVPRLQNAGFVCSPDGANPPSFDCVRIRNRLVASCVERVTFVDTVVNHGAVSDVRVAAIACAGL